MLCCLVWRHALGLMLMTVHLQASCFSNVLKKPTRWLSAWTSKMGTSQPLLNHAPFLPVLHPEVLTAINKVVFISSRRDTVGN